MQCNSMTLWKLTLKTYNFDGNSRLMNKIRMTSSNTTKIGHKMTPVVMRITSKLFSFVSNDCVVAIVLSSEIVA